jgi:hypothetical protein
MFCSHNEVDLEPDIVYDDKETDWVVVRCTSCKKLIGKRYKLVALISRAITARRARAGE